MSKVNEILKEVRENITTTKTNNEGQEVTIIRASSSKKDEIRVMKEMLNDKEYEVGVYTNKGKVDTYNPSKDARDMIANILTNVTKINMAEAEEIASNYVFSSKEAKSMVSLSKEFINTYLETGRTLNLGGRETFNTQLKMIHVDEKERTRPVLDKETFDKTGEKIYERVNYKISEHDSIKAKSSCPKWLK